MDVYNQTSQQKMLKVASFITIIFLFIMIYQIAHFINNGGSLFPKVSNEFTILSSYDNKDLEEKIVEEAKTHGFNATFKYVEDIDAISILNSGKEYDAVWLSNSMWLYMLRNITIRNSKSTSINPIVMGIKKDKATSLGFVDHDIYNRDILKAIKDKRLKYIMTSPVKTNTGLTAYLNFLTNLAGSPEVLTLEMLNNKTLQTNLVSLFNGVERVSGDDTFLEDMFLNSNDYEAVISTETSLIKINQKLVSQNKAPLYLLYPKDGVAINDAPFAYVDYGQKEDDHFKIIQDYILSNDIQKELEAKGRRTWYGGTKVNADKKVFNPDWGINTNEYLISFKYPSKAVIDKSLELYVESFRKPGYTIFCLDYSGSMYGDGAAQLESAMTYILNNEQAKKEYIQFAEKDKITVIPFSTFNLRELNTNNGKQTSQMISDISNLYPSGSTNMYGCAIRALDILDNVSDEYSKTVILMTDGEANVGTYESLDQRYKSLSSPIPMYSIMFGNASSSQLSLIANLTNAKVFDGRSNLIEAFKAVRSYN